MSGTGQITPTAPDSDRHPEVPALLRGLRRILTSSCMLASFEARFARTSGSAVSQRRLPLVLGGRETRQTPADQVIGSGTLLRKHFLRPDALSRLPVDHRHLDETPGLSIYKSE